MPVNRFNHTSWVTAVTPTDRPKSVRNSCVIKVFGGGFMLSRCFLDCSVGVGVFVTGLSQISSFFSYGTDANFSFQSFDCMITLSLNTYFYFHMMRYILASSVYQALWHFLKLMVCSPVSESLYELIAQNQNCINHLQQVDPYVIITRGTVYKSGI